MSNSPKIITARQAYGALRETVDTYGAGTIADCIYVQENEREGEWEPVCIVGHALVELGVDPGDLVRVSNASYPIGNSNCLRYLEEDAGVRLSQGAVSVLRQAQVAQDGGDDWGEALGFAEVAYHYIKDDGREDSEEC